MQNLRFVSSAVPEILGASQNVKSMSHELGHTPLLTNFSIFGILSLTFIPRAKFEICICSHSRDIRGVPKLTKYVMLPRPRPLLTNFLLFGLVSLMVNPLAKFEVCTYDSAAAILKFNMTTSLWWSCLCETWHADTL